MESRVQRDGEQVLHLVIAEQGEYSDRSEWPVRAFVDPMKAANYAIQARARAEELRAQRELMTTAEARRTLHSEFDDNLTTFYDPVFYSVVTVPLDDDVLRELSQVTRLWEARRRALCLDKDL